MPHIDRKQYWQIFAALTVLTILEVGVVYIPGIAFALLLLALVALALVKAGLVGLFYMHLGHETKPLRATIAVPLALPGIYALVLIFEAMWRMLA